MSIANYLWSHRWNEMTFNNENLCIRYFGSKPVQGSRIYLKKIHSFLVKMSAKYNFSSLILNFKKFLKFAYLIIAFSTALQSEKSPLSCQDPFSIPSRVIFFDWIFFRFLKGYTYFIPVHVTMTVATFDFCYHKTKCIAHEREAPSF